MLLSSPKLDRAIYPDLLLVIEARKYERTSLSLPFKRLQEFCSGGGSQWRQLLTSFWVRLSLPFTFQQLKINIQFLAGLFLGGTRFSEKDKAWQNFQRFCRQKSRRWPTVYSNRLLSAVKSTGALFRANSWHLQTVQLHRELNKYVMGVFSDKFAAVFSLASLWLFLFLISREFRIK